MQFLDLTDDVFLYICDYLTGPYSLDFALTCKRLYSFAINRATITFIASSLRGLRAFHRCVLHSSPSRIQYVKRLEITRDVLAYNNYRNISQDSVKVLVDLLRHTHNLTKLAVHCVHLMRQAYPHIALPAIFGLRNLTHLQMHSISDDDVKLIGESGWDIHELSLDYAEPIIHDHWHLNPTILSNPYLVLVDTIAKLPHLYSPRLRNLKPQSGSVPIPGDGNTPISGTFSSIRRLSILHSKIIPALDLISRCPNLNVLDISNATPEDDLTEHQFALWDSWPPLRSLRCDIRYMIEACENHVVDVSTALHLQVSEVLTVGDVNGGAGGGHGDGNEHEYVDGGVNGEEVEDESKDENDIPALLSMLPKISPTWLQVALVVQGTPMRFWKDVPSLASRLRYLELKIVLKDVKEEYADWLESVPNAVGSLPLYYLKLYISELPAAETVWNCITGELVRDSDGQYVHKATKEGALTFAFYTACVTIAETLPERCARAISTLKFFVLSDKGDLEQFERARRATGGEPQDGFILPIGQQEAKEGAHADEEIVEIREACETDDCSYMHAWLSDGKPGTVRSWRIARDATGDGVRLHRLKLNQGRRLERCLSACFDDKDPFNDIVTFYRDSDPEA